MPPVRLTPALRVLAIPSAHPYSERLRSTSPGASRVVHLDDPAVPGAPAGAVVATDRARRRAGCVATRARSMSCTCTSASTPPHRPTCGRWVRALREAGIPLVLTLHDLVNPHFTDQRDHLARLDVLVPAADALITLTAGAASEIEQRWGRSAEVLAHPHVAPLELVGAAPAGRRTTTRVPSSSASTSRACAPTSSPSRSCASCRRRWRPSRTRSSSSTSTVTCSTPRTRATTASCSSRSPTSTAGAVCASRCTSVAPTHELWEHLRGLDLAVLPYAFGTHSGWVEACHDLGTTVLAPRTGHWVEQQPMLTFGWRAGGGPRRGPGLLRRAARLLGPPPLAGRRSRARRAAGGPQRAPRAAVCRPAGSVGHRTRTASARTPPAADRRRARAGCRT